MGEEEFRIHNVGAPQLDEIYQNKVSSIEIVNKKYNIDLNKDYCLVVLHPVTEELDEATNQIDTLYKSLLELDQDIVWILPNNDAGGYEISNYLKNNRKNNFKLFRNVPREDYLCFLKESNCLIGNSSSGILEAPSFKIPVINIGSRQEGRVRSKNIIDVKNFTQRDIIKAIDEASSKSFEKKLEDIENPYGNGESSKKIIDLLISLKGHKDLLKKRITY